MNPENKIAVTTFEGVAVEDDGTYDNYTDAYNANGYVSNDASSYKYDIDSKILQEWITKEQYDEENQPYINAEAKRWNGTNYIAGLKRAEEMFKKVESDNHKKMMLFLSDGVPTYYINSDGSRGDDNQGVAMSKTVADSREKTMKYFDDFVKNHSEILVHTVGVSAGINGATDDTNPEVLKYMADLGGGNFVAASNAEELNAIKDLIFPKATGITDKLSSYVQYYETDPDLKVVRTSADGKTTESLYENGRVTDIGRTGNNGGPILDLASPVVYTETKDDLDSTGTVAVNFAKDFVMKQSWTYTLSFNVKATDKAYESYAKGDAAASGDNDTDYGQNITSSGKSGLHSNKEATVKYIVNDIEYTEDYPKPVIQVDKCTLTLTKKADTGSSLMGVSFSLKRGNDTGGSDKVGTYTTDSNGKIEIPSRDLLNGNYTLEETNTADGYVKTTETVSFKVTNGMITHTGTYNDWTWEPDPEKAGNASANQYPKNNTYPYALSLINRSKPQQVILQKTDEKNAPLNGATFSLYRDCTAAAAENDRNSESFRVTVGNKEETVWGLPVDGKQDMTSRDEMINGASLGGVIYSGEFSGGKYYLLETAAPDGYHRLEEPIVITVGKDGVSASYCGQPADVGNSGETPATYTVRISNTPGGILPNTGGIGTGWYTLGGILLMAAALLCYIKKRRRKEAKVL